MNADLRAEQANSEASGAEVILNEPRMRALVGQSEAASVAQHCGDGRAGAGKRRRCRAYTRDANALQIQDLNGTGKSKRVETE